MTKAYTNNLEWAKVAKVALSDWLSLQTFLRNHTEEQIWDLLEMERASARRISFMNRIYGRAAELRKLRERALIKKEARR